MRNAIVLTIIVLLVFGITLADLNEGLVAHYPFNGNANDESGNGNDGTVYGATLTTDRFGDENSAYSFDGVDDGIVIQDNASFNNGIISLIAWIKPNVINENGRIISKDNGSSIRNWFLAYYGDYGYAHFGVFSGSDHLAVHTYSPISIEDWIHLVAIFDGTYSKIYLNGVIEDSLIIPNGMNHQVKRFLLADMH